MTESTPWTYPLVRHRRFLTGFTEDRGGFKPKPNSKQSLKAIALPVHQMGGVGESRHWRPQTTVMEQLLNHLLEHKEHSTVHQRAHRFQAGSGWHHTLPSLLHKTLYKRHPEEPAGRKGEVGNDQRRKETAPACAGILTSMNRQLGTGTRGKGLTTGTEMREKP